MVVDRIHKCYRSLFAYPENVMERLLVNLAGILCICLEAAWKLFTKPYVSQVIFLKLYFNYVDKKPDDLVINHSLLHDELSFPSLYEYRRNYNIFECQVYRSLRKSVVITSKLDLVQIR